MQSDTTPYAYCIFQQPWWLDAVAPGAWGAVEVEEAGEVIGRLVFARERRLGLRILGQPPLTQFAGPWLGGFKGKPASRPAWEDRVLDRLITALPPHDVFRQTFHYAVTRWLSFYWTGFRQTARFSYVLEDLSDLDRIWAAFRVGERQDIRKAEKVVVVKNDGDVETLLMFVNLTFRRQGLRVPYQGELLRRLVAACAIKGQGSILVARDGHGRPCGATLMVWDENSAYGLGGGVFREPHLRGVDGLLLWESIKHAQKVTCRFDFGGSMIRGVEQYVRGFGGHPMLYSQIVGGSTVMGRVATSGAEFLLDRRRRLRDAA